MTWRPLAGDVAPGTIVYCQGRYRCEVVRDLGTAIEYVAHEGAPIGGGPPKTWTASRDLFALLRS